MLKVQKDSELFVIFIFKKKRQTFVIFGRVLSCLDGFVLLRLLLITVSNHEE